MDESDMIEEMFAERVCDPLSWFEHSRALIASARICKERADELIHLVEKAELEKICSMLYGLAIENLFKAVWIYRKFGSPHYESWEPVAEFPKEIKTHDLVKLAEKIDESLVDKYEDCLTLLSQAATWSGRYPCSIDGREGSIIRMPSIHDDAEKIYARYRKYFTISS